MQTPAPKRPYIPVAVKLEVAWRQLIERTGVIPFAAPGAKQKTLDRILRFHLGFTKPQLDHVPALALRHRNKRTGRYTPDANDRS
jgi:hypothetical protein